MEVLLNEVAAVRIAVVGCGHGHLNGIYASLAESCKQRGWQGVDLLIIGGDFQAVRNAYDLNCTSMPAKYRRMGDFHEYYSGQRKAPYLTIFIGGNHEASNYLFELYYGGWVAPNIYYMGAANVIKLGPIRIVGMSGIWKGYEYRRPHFERIPYNDSDKKSIYHVRELDIRKLLQISTQVDIGMSHDWPRGVEWNGDHERLFRIKGHLQGDAERGDLGSVAAKYAMDWLRPKHWFSAHLHCDHAAVVDYEDDGDTSQQISNSHAGAAERPVGLNTEIDSAVPGPPETGGAKLNEDEIDLDDDSGDDGGRLTERQTEETNGDQMTQEAPPASWQTSVAALPESFRRNDTPKPVKRPNGITNKSTRFLALDKLLPNRKFLQLTDIAVPGDSKVTRPLHLEHDREWLAITRSFALNEPLEIGDPDVQVPRAKTFDEYQKTIQECREWVDANVEDADLLVPENFEVTAPVYDGGDWNARKYATTLEYPNPQTARFCEMLGIPNAFELDEEQRTMRMKAGRRANEGQSRHSGGGNNSWRGGSGRGGFDGGRGRGGRRGGWTHERGGRGGRGHG